MEQSPNSTPASQHELNISNPTGVELSLPIAGPGGRSYAYTIDWHIRVLLVLAWFLLLLLLRYTGLFDWLSVNDLLVSVPAFLIYFLYHPVIEVLMRGSTPGKRKAGVRIVTEQGLPPSSGALIVRNIFRLIDALPMLYVVGLVTCIATRQSVRLGDLAAGTLLIYDKSEPSLDGIEEFAGRSGMTAGQIEVVQELLERWKSLTPENRIEHGQKLLQRIGETLPLTESQRATASSDPNLKLGARSELLEASLRSLLNDRTGQ